MTNQELINKYKELGIGQEKYIDKNYKRPDKDPYFLKIAYEISHRSHDSTTQHGCCIVKDGRIISTGYNGFPPGLPDELIPNNRLDGLKYKFICHAEKNAIYNAAKEGICLQNSVIYITGIPCSDCSKALVAVGIKKWIIGDKEYIADEQEKLLRNFWVDVFDVKIQHIKGIT